MGVSGSVVGGTLELEHADVVEAVFGCDGCRVERSCFEGIGHAARQSDGEERGCGECSGEEERADGVRVVWFGHCGGRVLCV